MNRARTLLAGLAALSLGASGCFYSFDNPVDPQPSGSITGKVELLDPGPGQDLLGGTITILWSNVTVPFPTAATTSPFGFVDLPDGVYTLSVYVPDAGPNTYPLLGLRPNVQLASAGAAGQYAPDAIDIGTLDIAAAGVVSGTVSGNTGSTVVGAYVPEDGGIGAYEAIESPVNADGTFSLTLPAGNHVLAASDSAHSGTAPVTVAAASSQSVSLALTSTPLPGYLTGNLVFGGFGLEGDVSNLLPLVTITAVASDGTTTVFDGGLSEALGAGAEFALPVPAGDRYALTFALSGGVSGADYPPLTLADLPAIAGQSTALDQVTWLTNVALAQDGGVNLDLPDAGSTTIPDSGMPPDSGTGPLPDSGTTSASGWSCPMADEIGWGDTDVNSTLTLPLADGGLAVLWLASSGVIQYTETTAAGFSSPIALTNGKTGSVSSFSAAPSDGGVIVAWITGNGALGALFKPIGQAPLNAVTPIAGYVDSSSTDLQQVAVVAGTQAGTPGNYLLALNPDGGVYLDFTPDNLNTQTVTALQVPLPDSGLFMFGQVAAAPCSALGSNNSLCLVGSDEAVTTVMFAEVGVTNGAPSVIGPSQFVPWPGTTDLPVASIASSSTDVGVLIGAPQIPSDDYFVEFSTLQNAPTLLPVANSDVLSLVYDGTRYIGVAATAGGLVADVLTPDGRGGVVDGGVITNGTYDPSSSFEMLLNYAFGFAANGQVYVTEQYQSLNDVQVCGFTP